MAGNLFDKTVCLSVTFRIPSNMRRGDLSRVSTDSQRSELVLRKRIFHSPIMAKIDLLAARTRRWLRMLALPCPLSRGTYLIPRSMLNDVEKRLDEVTDEFNELADQFVNEYPALIEQWREKLGSQFNPNDYLSVEEVRQCFSVNRFFVDFRLPSEIDQNNEIESAINEIKLALREGLLELVQKLADMLGDDKKCRVNSRTIERFQQWLELLPKRNVLDDTELRELAEQAKSLMAGKSAEDLRDYEAVRNQVREGMRRIANKLQESIEQLPVRRFTLED